MLGVAGGYVDMKSLKGYGIDAMDELEKGLA